MPWPSHYGIVPPVKVECTGTFLRKLLEDIDVTNVEAAQLAGCALSSMYRWLNDEKPVPVSVVRMFAYHRHIQQGQEMIKISWSEPEEGVQG